MFRQLGSRFIANICLRHAGQIEVSVNQLRLPLIPRSGELLLVRSKYVTSGVQGRRSSKTPSKKFDDEDDEDDGDDGYEESPIPLKDSAYDAVISEALGKFKSIQSEESILVIQPYIKWGPKKSTVSPDIKLQEAEDLIRSLDSWSISESIKVPLVGFGKKTFFGRGKIDDLRRLVKKNKEHYDRKITGVFVSVSTLNQLQKHFLEDVFGVPVMDRFSIVIQILKAHATSRDAKLQISLAELPYIWQQLGTDNSQFVRSQLTDSQKMMLRNRERRIKNELKDIRVSRKRVRTWRSNKEIPIVAVVGYTNAGKTSLIKALTNKESLLPQNKLFATLDVTAHEGRLPSNVRVLYIDTIGFMSDIPTGLFQCFITTLEDAMSADLIIHVQDVSHINVSDQRQHVEKTLENLMYNSESEKTQLLKNIINVGNKCDLVENLDQRIEIFEELTDENETSEPMHFISCTKGSNISNLKEAIEKNILKVTNRKKLIIRVPQGGEEIAWLYKNMSVTHTEMCEKNHEYIKVHVLFTDLSLTLFKNTFLKKTTR